MTDWEVGTIGKGMAEELSWGFKHELHVRGFPMR